MAFEQPETRTGEMLALALKLFYATLMNVGFLFLLVGGNFDVFTLGRSFDWTRAFKSASVMSGTFSDFNVQWCEKSLKFHPSELKVQERCLIESAVKSY